MQKLLHTATTSFTPKVTKKGVKERKKGMRRTMIEFSEHEKALMLELIIDLIIKGYEQTKTKMPKDLGYHSIAEMNGYEILTNLNNNGFITTEGILGN